MRNKIDEPYEIDEWSFYGILKHRIEGNDFPLAGENSRGETVILTEGINNGVHFITLKTYQKNNWICVCNYYEDGTVEEMYEK